MFIYAGAFEAFIKMLSEQHSLQPNFIVICMIQQMGNGRWVNALVTVNRDVKLILLAFSITKPIANGRKEDKMERLKKN